MVTPVPTSEPFPPARRRQAPATVKLLGGCQTALGLLFLGAFTYGSIGADYSRLSTLHGSLGGLIAIFLVAWLVAGIGLLVGRTWAWWLSGFTLLMVFIRQILDAAGKLMLLFAQPSLGRSDYLLAPNYALQPLLILLPLFFWQLGDVRSWCGVRTTKRVALPLAVLAAVATYTAVVALVVALRTD